MESPLEGVVTATTIRRNRLLKFTWRVSKSTAISPGAVSSFVVHTHFRLALCVVDAATPGHLGLTSASAASVWLLLAVLILHLENFSGELPVRCACVVVHVVLLAGRCPRNLPARWKKLLLGLLLQLRSWRLITSSCRLWRWLRVAVLNKLLGLRLDWWLRDNDLRLRSKSGLHRVDSLLRDKRLSGKRHRI